MLLLPLLLGTAPAVAKKKHKKPKSPPVTVVSASGSTSTDNQQVTVTASCPPGLIAVGGGFLSPPILVGGSPTDLNIVYESRRSGESAWQVSAVREDASGPGPDLALTATVDCRSTRLATKKPSGKKATAAKKKKKRRLTVTEVSASSQSAASSGSQADATATCPTGTQALGGGFSSSPTPQLSGSVAFPIFWTDRRTGPTTWQAALSSSGNVARTVTSFAYCATGLKIAETSGSATLPGSGPAASSAAAVTPLCPGGKALLGGGFSNTPATATSAIALLSGSSAVNGSWRLDALNDSTIDGTIASFGYCA